MKAFRHHDAQSFFAGSQRLIKVLAHVGCTAAFAFFLGAASAGTLGPTLSVKLSGLADSAPVGVVVVAFNTSGGLATSHLNLLRSIGITKGITYARLGMVGCASNCRSGQSASRKFGSAVSLVQRPADLLQQSDPRALWG